MLYSCETWSLKLRLKVFENRILRRIFGTMRDVNEEWRSLRNGKLHSNYRLTSIDSRRLRWAGPAVRMGEGGVFLKP